MTYMTVLELLLDMLPTRYVDAVVNNMDDRSQLHQEAGTFSSELMTLFDWHKSREGYEFWDEVLESTLTNQKLPEIPITIDYAPSTMFLCGKHLYIMNAGGTDINMVYDIVDLEFKKMAPNKKEKFLALLN